MICCNKKHTHRTGLNFKLTVLTPTAVVERQQARLEKMKIELRTEKVKLVSLQKEVARLERGQTATIVQNAKAELVSLQKEIEELRGQCDKLTIEVDTQYGYTGKYVNQTTCSLGFSWGYLVRLSLLEILSRSEIPYALCDNCSCRTKMHWLQK